MSNFIKEIIKGTAMFFVFGISAIAIISLIDNKKTYTVVEQNVEIQKHNDSLKIKVDNLDSIKNAKVIEVKALDNDSTVKLFYQLIK
jgi:hypothetical protein